ncbi:hypothetical protein AeMF1_005319 [Aphanomyces euteiches]|nr:hypothetical protein AeMF1_005319 [Aphanomyces euteiches]
MSHHHPEDQSRADDKNVTQDELLFQFDDNKIGPQNSLSGRFTSKCKMTIAADATQRVFTSLDLVCQICRFQRGYYKDMVPFLRFQWVAKWCHSIELHHVREIHAIFRPWYAQYGHTRLSKLLEELPFTTTIALIYSANLGEKDLFQAVHAMASSSLCRARRREILSVALASKNQLGAIECLAVMTINRDEVFVYMSEAISNGNTVTAQHLALQMRDQDERTMHRRWFFPRAQDRIQSHARQAMRSNRLEGVCWLLETYAHCIPAGCSKWIARLRRDCRRWALEFHHFDSLPMLSNSKMQPSDEDWEDLMHCIKSSLLEAVAWLVCTKAVHVQPRHILQAAKSFQPYHAPSMAIFVLVLSTVVDKREKIHVLTLCNDRRFKHGRTVLNFDRYIRQYEG